MHGKTPGLRHQMLLDDLHGVTARYKELPAVERLAIASQFIGQLVRELPDGPYTKEQILQSVAGNMQAGNARDDRGPLGMEGLGHA